MKYLGKRFSFSMPGNKVDWPFPRRRYENQRTLNCPHPAVRRTLIEGVWMCRDCKDRHGKLIVDIL
jgi:ribosomal protein L37AE/L43A